MSELKWDQWDLVCPAVPTGTQESNSWRLTYLSHRVCTRLWERLNVNKSVCLGGVDSGGWGHAGREELGYAHPLPC